MTEIIRLKVLFLCTAMVLVASCKNSKNSKPDELLAINSSSETQKPKTPLTQEFKDYWYAGEAEITSFKLEQARYGEIREGNAVLIYVTEDFLPEAQVKADNQNPKNVPVLKLNATKNFNTGIYPYSIMQSTFYPVGNHQHAIKISSSMQEWCGHVYAQMNNREQFDIMSHSYFEGEADQRFKLEKTVLENELWTQLRINPQSLPTGNIEVIPSFEFTRLKHASIKAYEAKATLNTGSYTLSYPNLNRTLTINFNPNFPYDILGWEETFKSGFGSSVKTLTTKASKLKTIKSPYWQMNHNKDEVLRDTLLLK
ncbi:septum formation inhibitor Maf [Hyunsoonleella aquatilis]|nr:septum formation inhibitor Maf [Hyunsoonleella aquatilis]